MLILLACAADTSDSADSAAVDALDLRIQEADLGDLADNQLVFEGPDTVIEPGDDVMICLFDTYDGDDVGLHDVHTYQASGGHHLQMMGTTTPAVDVPDGTVMDCTGEGGDFQMSDLEPVGITNGGHVGGEEIEISMPLPEGMAFELEKGQRFVMQSHYINSGTEPIRVRDLAVLTLTPEDEVSTWAAPLIFNRDDFEIPPGGTLSTDFECTTDTDWNFLYVLGHMHEWGTSFSIERRVGENLEAFYDIPEWDPVYRDAPIVDYYPDATMAVPAGTTFKTSCSWFNDKDEPLLFPHEMCVGVNIVYPQKATVICDGNE
ncbi:MAG: hypothetical protein FJ102_16305 [Deltaproteobacteria bacterium]|nr:hypothetical protein [Deltaproteobacteria bacterium]